MLLISIELLLYLSLKTLSLESCGAVRYHGGLEEHAKAVHQNGHML